MTDIEMAKWLHSGYQALAREAKHRRYTLKASSMRKLAVLRDAVKDDRAKLRCSFDAPTNNIDISIKGYVLDSIDIDFKAILSAVDQVSIDATTDGVIHFAALISNACDWRERDAETGGANAF